MKKIKHSVLLLVLICIYAPLLAHANEYKKLIPSQVDDVFYQSHNINAKLRSIPVLKGFADTEQKRILFNLIQQLIDKQNKFDISTVTVLHHKNPVSNTLKRSSIDYGYSDHSVWFKRDAFKIRTFFTMYYSPLHSGETPSRINIVEGLCVPLHDFQENFKLKFIYAQTWRDVIRIGYGTPDSDAIFIEVLVTPNLKKIPFSEPAPLDSCVTGLEWWPRIWLVK